MRLRLIAITLLCTLLAACHRDRAAAGADAIFTSGGADALASRMTPDSMRTPLDVWLSGAIINPGEAMTTLRSLTEGGRISRPGYPMVYSNSEWAAAAWEVYCTTGSDEWLREAYNTIMATLRSERAASPSTSHLVNGTAPHLEGEYPSWFDPTDRIESTSLYTNAFHHRALEVAADMASILGLGSEEPLRREAKQAREAINSSFWDAPRRHYGRYLYTGIYPLLSSTPDCAANYLCVLHSIAVPEMGSALVAALRHTPATPHTLALASLAAARTGNPEAFNDAVAALWTASDTIPAPFSWSAVLLRGIFGLRPTPAGLEVSPFVTDKPWGQLKLADLSYREATLTITLQGTGDRIASFMIDSVASPHIIPSTLKGHHRVDIMMASNILSSDTPVRNPDPTSAPPPHMATLHETAPGVLSIEDPEPGVTYDIYADGVLDRVGAGSVMPGLPDVLVTAAIPVGPDGVQGLSGRPWINRTPQRYVRVNASSITPRRPPINLIKDHETATNYIELAPRHNTRLTFYANIPVAGHWLVRIIYSNGTSATARRTLGIIDPTGTDTPVGQMICPPVREADWTATSHSTWVPADLGQGPNRLSLTYETGTILLNRIELIRLK